MLGFFKYHEPSEVIRINNSFMVCGKSDELWWYIHCDNIDDYCQFFEDLGNGKHYIVLTNDWMLGELENRFEINWMLTCNKFYLPEEVQLPESRIVVKELLAIDVQCIYNNSNYKTYTSPDYIAKQIELRSGVAYYDSNKLVAWAMFHDDGAMGFLHVMKNYRRRGIARELVIELCKRCRTQNQIPYTSIEPTNIPSLEMVKSIGFKSFGNIHWVCFQK
jgi:8-oxo-dGTP diphosphatase